METGESSISLYFIDKVAQKGAQQIWGFWAEF
jgi:hypothetical protein